MSATFTVAGTWTPLGINFTGMAKAPGVNGVAPPNVPHVDSFQGEALKAATVATGSVVVGFPELIAFIQAMADGYGIQFNAAKALLYAIMTAEMNREDPMMTSGTLRTWP
jgi:hypothetical protein